MSATAAVTGGFSVVIEDLQVSAATFARLQDDAGRAAGVEQLYRAGEWDELGDVLTAHLRDAELTDEEREVLADLNR